MLEKQDDKYNSIIIRKHVKADRLYILRSNTLFYVNIYNIRVSCTVLNVQVSLWKLPWYYGGRVFAKTSRHVLCFI